jgi:SAM-dependent methyltransferase
MVPPIRFGADGVDRSTHARTLKVYMVDNVQVLDTQYLQLYADILRKYETFPINLTQRADDPENPVRDDWHVQHYFDVGREAVQLVVRLLVANVRLPPGTILDFPSGSGRVTRHLRAMFPNSRIAVCDLYQEHIAFCEAEFGAEPIRSKKNPDDLMIEPEWDLVFCGSLLTHLPEILVVPTVRFMVRALSRTGMAIVTLAGRRAEEVQDHHWKMIEDKRFETIRRRYRKRGFGFANYTGAHRRLFAAPDSYGIALVKPSWILSVLECMPDIRILGYFERVWDDNQDLVAFGHPAATG